MAVNERTKTRRKLLERQAAASTGGGKTVQVEPGTAIAEESILSSPADASVSTAEGEPYSALDGGGSAASAHLTSDARLLSAVDAADITGADITERVIAERLAAIASAEKLRATKQITYSKEPIPLVARNGVLKTRQMMLLELEHQTPIEDLLEGSLSKIAKRLGIDFTTASKWRKKLGLS